VLLGGHMMGGLAPSPFQSHSIPGPAPKRQAEERSTPGTHHTTSPPRRETPPQSPTSDSSHRAHLRPSSHGSVRPRPGGCGPASPCWPAAPAPRRRTPPDHRRPRGTACPTAILRCASPRCLLWLATTDSLWCLLCGARRPACVHAYHGAMTSIGARGFHLSGLQLQYLPPQAQGQCGRGLRVRCAAHLVFSFLWRMIVRNLFLPCLLLFPGACVRWQEDIRPGAVTTCTRGGTSPPPPPSVRTT